MKRLVLLCACGLAGGALASGVDDALQAVHDAQKANQEGPECKGLSTKLKLSVETLEHAQKSPVAAVFGQAKGRLETARDFASSSCTGAVHDKVTQSLDAALASLAKAAEPPKKEHTGAAFKAACRENDACASEICFVGASGDGYCSKQCAAASDCPERWACRRPGSEAQTICIK